MTDDDRLRELFRAAATDTAAPSAFDHSDVVTASRRITARRRRALVGGLSVVALVGIGATAVLPSLTSSRDSESTAAAPAMASDSAGGEAAPGAGSDVPFALREAAPPGVPLGPGTAPCADPQDPELRGLVEQVLPEVIGAPELATTDICRDGGGRGTSVEVDGGLLSVSYLPPGAAAVPDGALSAQTASGGTVVVSSRPTSPGGPVPFEGRLDTTVAFLAQRL